MNTFDTKRDHLRDPYVLMVCQRHLAGRARPLWRSRQTFRILTLQHCRSFVPLQMALPSSSQATSHLYNRVTFSLFTYLYCASVVCELMLPTMPLPLSTRTYSTTKLWQCIMGGRAAVKDSVTGTNTALPNFLVQKHELWGMKVVDKFCIPEC